MKNHLRTICCLLFFLFFFPALLFPAESGTKRILILNSYHSEYQWTRDQVESFSQMVRERFPDAEIFTEFLDAKRIDRTTYLRAFGAMLAENYRGMKFSLVYATDDIALDFAQSFSAFVWNHSTPIVATGINDIALLDPDLHPFTYGIFEDEPGEPVVREALLQNPKASQIVIIADGTSVGREIGDQIEAGARAITRIPVIRTPVVPWDSLMDFISRYDSDTIFLLALFAVDSRGGYIDPTSAATEIALHAKGPVYAFTDMYMKSPDVLGGLVNSGRLYGQAAGKIADELLDGRAPEWKVMSGTKYQQWVFNLKALERFGLAGSKLPEGTIIQGVEKGFLRQHAGLFVAILIGILSQTTLIVILLVNISRRRAATRRLAQSEAQLSKLVENSPVAITISDESGRILRVNRRYRQMTGYDASDLVSLEHLQELVFPDPVYRQEVCLKMSAAMALAESSEEPPPPIHYKGRIKSGAILEIEAYFATAGGLRFRILLDVTQQTQVVRELRDAESKARAASEAKSRFLANMSHEIRTPMNGIMGMVQLLRDGAITSEQRECVATIQESCDILLTVINDILDISKIEAGKVSLDPEPVLLGEMLRRVAGMAAPTIDERGLEFNFVLGENLPEAVICDPARLKQVLLNLLVNASKFTDKGSVELHVCGKTIPGGMNLVTFAVKDTGIGIPADQLERVFEPFIQVDTSSTRKKDGTGLGLTICRKLVNLMGGEISLESTPGKGSTFRFSIPLQLCDPSEVRSASAEVIAEGLNATCPVCILVAEDNPVNQKVVGMLLAKLGYKADFVSNGAEALSAVTEKHYDLVFMDVQMPVMDGIEATRKIRERLPADSQPRIVALTAHAMGEDAQRCIGAGMDGHITKPVKIEALRRAIEATFVTLNPPV
jgi:signal transduction histidine kinase/ActR/RegA family two-component response regulator